MLLRVFRNSRTKAWWGLLTFWQSFILTLEMLHNSLLELHHCDTHHSPCSQHCSGFPMVLWSSYSYFFLCFHPWKSCLCHFFISYKNEAKILCHPALVTLFRVNVYAIDTEVITVLHVNLNCSKRFCKDSLLFASSGFLKNHWKIYSDGGGGMLFSSREKRGCREWSPEWTNSRGLWDRARSTTLVNITKSYTLDL